MKGIFQDWGVNKGNSKGQLILVLYRVASLGRRGKIYFLLLIPYLLFYRFFVEWILGVELPYKAILGSCTRLYHGQALVINKGTIIGNNCTLRHCITIGNKILTNGEFSECPKIGSNVEMGSNVCIIGPITIGDNVIIGAGSIVVKDIPSNCVVVGNPAKVIKFLDPNIS